MSITSATAATAAVVFLDLQADIVTNSRTQPPERVIARAASLAKLAALHEIPTLLSAVPPGGAFAADVLGPLGSPAPHMRTRTSAFEDPAFVDALAATGRAVLVLSGVASEIVVQRTALGALAAGYAVHVAVDACGGVGERTEHAAWQRIAQAGGTLTSAVTFAAELAGDFATESGGATLGIMYEMLGG